MIRNGHERGEVTTVLMVDGAAWELRTLCDFAKLATDAERVEAVGRGSLSESICGVKTMRQGERGI